MEFQEVRAKVQKLYDSRRGALNVFEALHPSVTPVLFTATNEQGEEVLVAEYEKTVALCSGVEYTVLKIEDPQEGVEHEE